MSLVDTQLVQLYFKDSGQRATEVDEEHYIARYIINKRETFARIHFVRADKFETALEDYGRLHTANCDIFSESCDEFYEGVLADKNRIQVFLEEFENEIKQSLWFRLLRSGFNLEASPEGIWLYWLKKESRVDIMIPVSEEAVAFLNQDNEARRHVEKALAKYYRYVGTFEFVEAVPF